MVLLVAPLAPKDSSGRQGYAFPIIGAGLMAAARAFLPAAVRGFRAARTYQTYVSKFRFLW